MKTGKTKESRMAFRADDQLKAQVAAAREHINRTHRLNLNDSDIVRLCVATYAEHYAAFALTRPAPALAANGAFPPSAEAYPTSGDTAARLQLNEPGDQARAAVAKAAAAAAAKKDPARRRHSASGAA